MAILRKGGNDPIIIRGWKDALKSAILDKLSDDKSVLTGDLSSYVLKIFNNGFSHTNPTTVEHVHAVLAEMYSLGWVEISEAHCVCCKDKKHPPNEFLKLAVRLGLTDVGREKISS